MINLVLTFCISLLIVAFSIPTIIKIAFKKRLFDAPVEARKIHKKIIPNLGGLAIFSGFVFTLAVFVPNSLLPVSNYLLASGVIIFIIGLKDDIIGVDPLKKFTAQFLAAFIIVILGDIRLKDLGGLFEIHELSYPFSLGLTVFAIVGIINAFNLIDGIDGLAGSLGTVLTFTYAYLFYQAGETGWVYLCLALAGSLIGFLWHNISPARIFMGDSGSLMIGFLAAVMSINFIDIAAVKSVDPGFINVTAAPALAVAAMILPLFDTLRVFTIRILNNESPFKADKNHMHHRLLFAGLNHTQATAVMTGLTCLFIAFALAFQAIGNNQLIGTMVLIILLLNTGFTLYITTRREELEEKQFLREAKEALRKTPRTSKRKQIRMFARGIINRMSERS